MEISDPLYWTINNRKIDTTKVWREFMVIPDLLPFLNLTQLFLNKIYTQHWMCQMSPPIIISWKGRIQHYDNAYPV